MFKIYDGRSQFYQWDLDRKLIVEDAAITEVHFCNRTDDCSLVCETYTEDGLNIVNVPNVLLQQDWRINVYAYDSNYTKFSKQFDVVRRSKPADYVYTETEIKNYDDLAERVDQIEKNGVSDAQIASAVGAYLDENPVEVDLTGYATEQYVIEAIGEIPQPDLSDYATIKDVQDAIDNLDIPEADVDLSNYYTKSEVDGAIEAIELTPGPAGKDGKDGVDGKDGEPGAPGKDGADYVLTEADKQEIAGMVEVTGGGGDHPVKAGEGENSVMSLGAKSASGKDSVALGSNASASGISAVALGNSASASQMMSTAIGMACSASQTYATAIGSNVSASAARQMVIGKYNAKDENATFIIGNGSGLTSKQNAMTIDAANQVHFPGTVVVGADKAEVATETYVQDAVNQALVGGDVDLSEYAKTADIEAKGYQTADQVSALINDALGVIENGTY